MADLQIELQRLVDALQDKQKAYDAYLEASKKHNEIILTLAERQPIDITDLKKQRTYITR